jgi:hypothetical protein
MSDFLDFLRQLLFRIQHKISITVIVTALSNRPVTLGDCQPSHPRTEKIAFKYARLLGYKLT